MSSGKWYWEVECKSSTSGQGLMIGILDAAGSITDTIGNNSGGYAYNAAAGNKYNNGSGSSYGAGFDNGDIIGVAYDADGGSLTFYKNGVSQGVAFSSITSKTYFPAIAMTGTMVASVNHGARPFAHTPPTGYKSLCTQNLPDPTIADGSTVFDVFAETGTGASKVFTTPGGFGPDLVWAKSRTNAYNHALYDTVRGATKRLVSNSTQAEDTQTQQVTAFSSTGFTYGTGNPNGSGESGVFWAWDAGSSNTSISAGGLNSTTYNQSQTWSGQITGTNYSGYPKTNAFNNDTTNYCLAGQGQELIFTPSPSFSSATTVKIWYYMPTSHANAIKINGTGVASNVATTGGVATHTFTVSGFTSLSWSRGVYASEDVGIARIDVDGVQLVDSGVSMPNFPSISSVVRANPSAGFSIVSWTASGTNNDSVGHGLNAVPSMWILKSRTGTREWYVYTNVIDGSVDFVALNSTAGKFDSSATAPTSSVFHVYGGTVNTSGESLIGYVFTPVEGYSAFGTYTGNGSADGPFVYTGFKPKWLLIKKYDSGANNWYILDTERDTYNAAVNDLYADNSNAENAFTGAAFDILSNGFKVRTAEGSINSNGGSVFYAAFAEHPLKHSRAR